MQNIKKSSSSLLKGMTEIIEFICISFYNGTASADHRESVLVDKLKLMISIEPELQKTTAGLNIFSIKGGHADKLWSFGYAMQELASGSHLTIYSPDIKDPEQVVASDVIFTSSRGESTSCFHIIDESIIKKDTDEIPLIRLKAFMSLSSVMNEGKNLVDYLCALKLMNPNALITFWMDCFSLSHLDLCEDTSMKCGTHTLYAQPQKCFIRNLNNDYICGTPIFQHSESRQILPYASGQHTFGGSIKCILCIILIHEHDDASGVVSKEENNATRTQDFVHGQAFIQVYNKNGLPIDMISLQKYINIQPDYLVSWKQFGLQVKNATLKYHPYSVQWLVRIIPDTILPPEFVTCSQFLLHFCFVLNDMEGYQLFSMGDASMIKNDIKPLRECADYCMKAVFVTHEEKLPVKHQNQTTNVFEYWIPDIANSLEEIFMRSTNAEFRTTFGNYIHSNTCTRGNLESLLWHAIRPSRNDTSQDPHAEYQFSCDVKKVTGLSLSPRTPISHRDNEIFTPDSLENDDHEWDTTNIRMDGLEENINDIECPLDLHGDYQHQFREKNSSKIITTFENEISFKPPHEKCSQRVDQSSDKIESPYEVYENTNECISFLNYHASYNLTDESWNLEGCESEDSLEMNTEKVSSLNETRNIADFETKVGNTEGRWIKKRSFEETETSLTFDNTEVELHDWMNLEDDLDQMKRLKLCDFEIKDDIHILSHANKPEEEEVAECKIIHEDPNCNTLQCREPQKLDVESRNPETLYVKRCVLHNDEQTAYKTAGVINRVDEADIFSDLHITETCRVSNIDHDLNIPNILHQNKNVSSKQDEDEVETAKREESRDAEKDCATATEEIEECATEEVAGFSSTANTLSEADVTVNEEEDWFDNKKLMDWYQSLYN